MKKTICFRTKYGWINASEEDSIITMIAFGKINNKGSSSSLNLFKKQMKEYLKGKKVSWNFKYKVNGSVAQKKIWSELSLRHGINSKCFPPLFINVSLP